LWKLNIKPGKPLAYGNLHNTPFFGLPGNPVSAFVTFVILVKPFLQKSQGSDTTAAQSLRLPAVFTWDKPGGRQEYLRARITNQDGRKVVELFPNQSSGALTSVAWANALVVIPPLQTVQRDDLVEVISLE
jgi:molybdopterin molybdotransferase